MGVEGDTHPSLGREASPLAVDGDRYGVLGQVDKKEGGSWGEPKPFFIAHFGSPFLQLKNNGGRNIAALKLCHGRWK